MPDDQYWWLVILVGLLAVLTAPLFYIALHPEKGDQ